jgi:hypothetical protein
MRKAMILAATAMTACWSSSAALALQAAPADPYLTPIGASNPSQSGQPFKLQTRDQDGNRIIINGRPVSGSGSTLSSSGSLNGGGSFAFGTMRSTSRGTTLSNNTLSAVSIANNISINNVKNSTIVINQTNNGDVSAEVNSTTIANDNDSGS